MRPVLEVPGVIVAGSEIPNLLEVDAASTLVVSEDVDIAVPVSAVDRVRRALALVEGFSRSSEEPSVYLPSDEVRLEVNFIGVDEAMTSLDASYVHSDPELPLLVFGALALLLPPRFIELGDLRVPVASTSGLILEKLMTERSGRKGDRDLLVVAGLLQVATDRDLAELVERAKQLRQDLRDTVKSNLAILSLIDAATSMPDPRASREKVAALLAALEKGERDG
ncbi:MAG: hypothetical protein KIT84_21755 [Labilithrix sp.]|nr:hypothetical protein [Labilithrix sp.]MCW5813670.1 hypothetical protein [Labilithrix sp.]